MVVVFFFHFGVSRETERQHGSEIYDFLEIISRKHFERIRVFLVGFTR